MNLSGQTFCMTTPRSNLAEMRRQKMSSRIQHFLCFLLESTTGYVFEQQLLSQRFFSLFSPFSILSMCFFVQLARNLCEMHSCVTMQCPHFQPWSSSIVPHLSYQVWHLLHTLSSCSRVEGTSQSWMIAYSPFALLNLSISLAMLFLYRLVFSKGHNTSCIHASDVLVELLSGRGYEQRYWLQKVRYKASLRTVVSSRIVLN